MKPEHVLASVVAALVVGAALLFTGVGPSPFRQEQAHPPCDQLPSRHRVARAIAEHPALVSHLEGVGPGIDVRVGTPCSGQPDKALVEVRFSDDDQRQGIEHVVNGNDGFGVPSMLTRK